MKRLAAVAAGTLAALASLPVLADASHKCPPHCPDGSLTIAVTPNPVTFGKAVTVAGKLAGGGAGVTVVLQADEHPFEGSYKDVAQTTTAQNGDYTFAGVRPTKYTNYRVRAQTSPPRTSSAVTTKVRISVRLTVSDSTPDRGERVKFSGTAKPEHDSNLVRVQRRLPDGSYKTIKTESLKDAGTDRSTYAARVRIFRDGVYRVKVSGDADHAPGTRKRRIDVEA